MRPVLGVLKAALRWARRCYADRRLPVSHLRQAMLNRLLHLAVEPLPLSRCLEGALEEILAAPWLRPGGSGMVYLLADGGQAVSGRVARGAGPSLDRAVAGLLPAEAQAAPLGIGGAGPRLACAIPAAREAAPFVFCWVPILSAGRPLGVLALSLSVGPEEASDLGPERDFLVALAGTLAAMIDRGRSQEQLRLFAAVFESAAEGIMVTDAENRIVAVNGAFCAITGYAAAEVTGRNPRFLRSDRHDDAFYAAIWAAIGRDSRWQGEIWNRRKSGEVYPQWLSISVIRDLQGSVAHYVGVFTDISMLKQSQTRMEYLAHHDALTGLPNRLLFGARLDHALQRANRERTAVALLFVDLDQFKAVNDSRGHLAGDELLQGVAERLRACVREQDTVARLAGDEFVVILEGLTEPSSARRVALKILEGFEAPFRVGGEELTVSVSIGVSAYPFDARDKQGLIEAADEAMYRAKEHGRKGYAFYRPEAERLRLPGSAERGRWRAP
jgi:diguanylate cyclase (GGDEF)-like protein/PAS domain S-box-containing protein